MAEKPKLARTPSKFDGIKNRVLLSKGLGYDVGNVVHKLKGKLCKEESMLKAGDVMAKVAQRQSSDNIVDAVRVQHYAPWDHWRTSRTQEFKYDTRTGATSQRFCAAKNKVDRLGRSEMVIKSEAAVVILPAVELAFADDNQEANVKAANILLSFAKEYKEVLDLPSHTPAQLKLAGHKIDAVVEGGGMDSLIHLLRSEHSRVRNASMLALSDLGLAASAVIAMLEDAGTIFSAGFFSDAESKLAASKVIMLCCRHSPVMAVAKGCVPSLLSLVDYNAVPAVQANALDAILEIVQHETARQHIIAYDGLEILSNLTVRHQPYIQFCAAIALVALTADTSYHDVVADGSLGLLPLQLLETSGSVPSENLSEDYKVFEECAFLKSQKAMVDAVRNKVRRHVIRIGLEHIDHLFFMANRQQIAACVSMWKTGYHQHMGQAEDSDVQTGDHIQLLETFLQRTENILCEERRASDLLVTAEYAKEHELHLTTSSGPSLLTKQMEWERECADLCAEYHKHRIQCEQYENSAGVPETSVDDMAETERELAELERREAELDAELADTRKLITECQIRVDAQTAHEEKMKQEIAEAPEKLQEQLTMKRAYDEQLKEISFALKNEKAGLKMKKIDSMDM